MTEVDLFISTKRIKVLTADTQVLKVYHNKSLCFPLCVSISLERCSKVNLKIIEKLIY